MFRGQSISALTPLLPWVEDVLLYSAPSHRATTFETLCGCKAGYGMCMCQDIVDSAPVQQSQSKIWEWNDVPKSPNQA